MTDAAFKKLQAQWYAAARADGFQDIESPSGAVPSVLSHGVSPARTKVLAQLEQDRAATERLRFDAEWERKAWELHLDGLSNREVAKRLCIYRKIVDLAFMRLRWQMTKKPRGRKPDPDSMRQQGMRMELLLTPAAALALDHLRTVLKTSKSEVVRRVLMDLARKTPGPSRGSGAVPPCSGMGKAA